MTQAIPHHIQTRHDLEALLRAVTNYEEVRPRREGGDPFRLDRVARFLEAVGSPQLGPETVHVAGSKGKGTTSRLLAAILREAGRGPVGLYTSPHLEDLSERIAIDGRPAPDEALARAGEAILPYVRSRAGEDDAPSFFEIMTAVAWQVFRAKGCRSVVLETGLGGRLDATNVCAPRAVLITSIELEHTQILGDTLAQVAREKGGILKSGVPAATAAEGVALATLEDVAAERACDLAVLGRDLSVLEARVGPGPRTQAQIDVDGEVLDLALPVAGAHHASNAALAAWAARQLGVGRGDVIEGIAQARLPGILETISTAPLVVIDGAHTPASAAATRRALDLAWPGRSLTLLVAMLEGKDPDAVLRPLVEGVQAVVTTELPTARTQRAADLAAAVARRSPGIPVEARVEREEAFDRARALTREDGILLATGSVRLAGWARGYASSPSRMPR